MLLDGIIVIRIFTIIGIYVWNQPVLTEEYRKVRNLFMYKLGCLAHPHIKLGWIVKPPVTHGGIFCTTLPR
eukprot:SAG11_NODE_2981_length_2794_cov_1.858256_1_plen_71_part_00